MDFEEVLEKFEPMISAHLRKLHIYKNQEQFRQLAREGVWKAWLKFDEEKGDFAPYVSVVIRGTMLDELKRTTRYEGRFVPTKDELLQAAAYEQAFEDEKQLLVELRPYVTADELFILEASYYGDFSNEEIANALHISRAALSKRKSRLLLRLRNELKKEDFI